MNPKLADFAPVRRWRAFTLLELLTVVALIGILASIAVPTARSIYIKAKKAKTRAQFSQWCAAMEMFNAEYGSFAKIDGNYSDGAPASENMLNSEKFSVALTGKKLDGTDATLRSTSATVEKKVGNTKLIAFYTIAEGELTESEGAARKIKDYFGNTEIGVLYDKTADGIINGSDVRTVPPVSAEGNAGKYSLKFDANKGLHVPVAFYSAGFGDSNGTEIEEDDAVHSWK
jgi:prepilin-type N-terminal cleavage/methylation domain-containing protein